MPNNPVFVFDGKLCKFEGMTKEQIINAIAEATGVTPQSIDEGFISTLVEQNKSRSIHVWKGTRSEYNALATKTADTLYVIDDDTTIADFAAALDNMDTELTETKEDVEELQNNMMDAQRDIDDLEDVFASFSSIPGDPSEWTQYDTDLDLVVESGMYIGAIGTYPGVAITSVIPFFVSSGNDASYSSPFLLLIWDGVSSFDQIECYIAPDGTTHKSLKVKRKDTGADVHCIIYYHKLFGTSASA